MGMNILVPQEHTAQAPASRLQQNARPAHRATTASTQVPRRPLGRSLPATSTSENGRRGRVRVQSARLPLTQHRVQGTSIAEKARAGRLRAQTACGLHGRSPKVHPIASHAREVSIAGSLLSGRTEGAGLTPSASSSISMAPLVRLTTNDIMVHVALATFAWRAPRVAHRPRTAIHARLATCAQQERSGRRPAPSAPMAPGH